MGTHTHTHDMQCVLRTGGKTGSMKFEFPYFHTKLISVHHRPNRCIVDVDDRHTGINFQYKRKVH